MLITSGVWYPWEYKTKYSKGSYSAQNTFLSVPSRTELLHH